MRAVVRDSTTPAGLRIGEVDDPDPTASQVLFEVHAASVNFGEVGFDADGFPDGAPAGWDAAGVVLRAAADGSGPPVGARVVGFGPPGAWAERRVVETADAAVVPDGVDLGAASALPGAGVSALRAVRRLGALLGERVLVTGASGGVGRFAVQLAAAAGAYVVAAVGGPGRGEGLDALGARQVVTALDQVTEPVHGVIDNVGGPLLAEAFALLGQGGCLLSVGMASQQPSTIDFEAERRRGSGGRIEVFVVGGGFGPDLAELLRLVEAGRLDPQVGWRGPWEDVADAVTALRERRVRGKAVLDVVPG